jgi:hypothetical protein
MEQGEWEMKVWIVINYPFAYSEQREIVGVFANEEAAKEFTRQKGYNENDFDIEEHEVQS